MNALNNIVEEIEKLDDNNNKALAYAHIVIHLMELKEIVGFNPTPNKFIQPINNILTKDFNKHIDSFIKYFNHKHKQLIIKTNKDE